MEDEGIIMPALQKLVIRNIWKLDPAYVERFCSRHAQSLRFLHLHYYCLDIGDSGPKIPGTDIPLAPLEALRRIRDCCSLREFKSSPLDHSSLGMDGLFRGRLPADESPSVFTRLAS